MTLRRKQIIEIRYCLLRHKNGEYQLYAPSTDVPHKVKVLSEPLPGLLERVKQEVRLQHGVEVYALRWILPEDIAGVCIGEPTLLVFVNSQEILDERMWINQSLVDTRAAQCKLSKAEAALCRHALKALPVQPWSHYRWFPKTRDWLDRELQDRTLTNCRSGVEQISISSPACVLGVNSPCGRFFLKTVRDRYRYEVNLTAWLSRTFPETTPSMVVADVPNARYLCHSSGHQSLFDLQDFTLWRSALQRLGTLQRTCVPHVIKIRNLGVPSHRLSQLPDRLASVLRRSINVLRESSQRLNTIQLSLIPRALTTVARLCRELESFQLPETLVHCDLNPSNIISGGRGPIFIDWTYSAVTHPFLGLSFCLFCCKDPLHILHKYYVALAEGYLEAWTSCGSTMTHLSGALQAASELAPYYNSLVALTLLLERLPDQPGELTSVCEVVNSIIGYSDRITRPPAHSR